MANKVKTRNFPVDMWRTNIMQMNMTAEDKFFWVYVNTNPQTTLLGVFALTVRQIACDMGYNEQTVKALIKRFVEYHKLIEYNFETGEIAILDYTTWGIKSGGKPIADALSGAYEQIQDKTLVKAVYDHLIAEGKKMETVVADFFASIDCESMKKVEVKPESKPVKEEPKAEKFSAIREIEKSDMGPEMKEAWRAFLEMRRSIEAPVTTQRALNGLINKLNRIGHNEREKIAIIDQSTERCWRGLFELSKSYSKQTQSNLPEWYDYKPNTPPSPELLEKALARQRELTKQR